MLQFRPQSTLIPKHADRRETLQQPIETKAVGVAVRTYT